MNRTDKIFCISFIATLAVCAFVAWLSGYDFNHRSGNVAAGFTFSLILSFAVSVIITVSKEDE